MSKCDSTNNLERDTSQAENTQAQLEVDLGNQTDSDRSKTIEKVISTYFDRLLGYLRLGNQRNNSTDTDVQVDE